jgi:hypothetical protein
MQRTNIILPCLLKLLLHMFIAIVFTHKDERQGARRKCHDRVLKTFDFAKNLYLTAEDATPRVISGEILYSASKLL